MVYKDVGLSEWLPFLTVQNSNQAVTDHCIIME